MKILVLGMGNELYGDDGVGIHVIRRIQEEREKKPSVWPAGVDFEECCLSGLSLLDVITGYDALLIIDTIKKSAPVTGRITFLEGRDLRHVPGPSPHYVSVPQTLAIGEKAGLKVPSTIKVIAVEAKSLYHLGEGLTSDMAAAVPKIVSRVKEALDSLLPKNSHPRKMP